MPTPRITAIIPAAGLSARMGDRNKLLLEIDGIPLIEHVVRTSLDQHFSRLLVVTGHDAENVAQTLATYPVEIVRNPGFEAGMGSSLIEGVLAGGTASEPCDAYLIWPADMPYIAGETVRMICESYDRDSIIVPTFRGKRGHPVLFSAKFREALLAIPNHEGARSVLDDFPHAVVELSVEDDAILRDIDAPEDLE